MTTLASTVANIRRLLQDFPLTDTLSASIAASSTTTMTVSDATKHAVGTWWEFADGDTVYETALDPTTSIATIRRGYLDSTAAAQSSGAVISKQPRFRYDTISQAVSTVLDADLFGEGIYELQEHQVTSSSITDVYNSPATDCERFLDVYQMTSLMTEPAGRNLRYSPLPTNVDTSLYANGKYFVIEGNYGTPGTDIYYVTCAHKVAITTASASQERIIDFLACAYLLEWTEPHRLAGPNNQGDITVRPGAALPTAGYFRSLAEEQMSKERKRLEDQFPAKRRFVRNG